MAAASPNSATTEALRRLVERARALGREPVEVESGAILLEEGEKNQGLFILLEGTAQLVKRGPDGEIKPVDLLGPGSLLGILSFWTGRPVFSGAMAATPLRVLRLEKADFDRGVEEDPEFARLTQYLLVENLSDRYRRVVGLNLKVAGLTRELESERNALREAVEDLRRTRNKLVHQEKLATMGQLLAGIAHEINNPASALMKNVASLGREMPQLFAEGTEERRMLEAGLAAPFMSGAETRERLREVQEAWPELPRGLCRRLARVPPEALEVLGPLLRGKRESAVEEALRVFDVGMALQSIRISEERITRLVKSLKSYSRQDEGEARAVQLEDCIRDTLTVLNHRLKRYELRLEFGETFPVLCRAGEINQVLTNLLTNACEATPEGKGIWVRTGMDAEGVWVEVVDEGPGLPEDLGERIFEPNITTKSGGGEYGLGLGLAISRDIALKHHGRLTARNRPEGGAVFRLILPQTG